MPVRRLPFGINVKKKKKKKKKKERKKNEEAYD